MSFPKFVAIVAIALFGFIAVAAWVKSNKNKQVTTYDAPSSGVIELDLDLEPDDIPATTPSPARATPTPSPQYSTPSAPTSDEELPTADNINLLFNTRGSKLPFVETLTYKSRVDWMKGRPAWLSDYAGHYKTSRHFIARSLNGKLDYFKQDIANGDRFNVFRNDMDLSFYLVVDTSRCKLWFYSVHGENQERTLLKTYDVSLGRLDSSSPSGLLTPLGRYSLGEKIAIYKPKSIGFFNGEKTEMIRVFGTRWIPFESEFEDATEPARGFGIHGVPWTINDEGILAEDTDSVGKYESDGCVRLSTSDMEELFSIIITKPTIIELVRDFHEAHLPGTEQ